MAETRRDRMMDLSKFPCHKKPYADSTLRNMKKGELIGILRDYEHNYGALYSFYENSVKNAEALLKKAERLSLGALLAVLQDGLVLHQCDSHNLIRAKGPALSPFHRFHARYHDDAEHSYHGQPHSLPISPRHFFPAPFQPRFPQMPNPFSQPVNRSLPRHGTAMLPTLSFRCAPRP